jgi:hypothetical protein
VQHRIKPAHRVIADSWGTNMNSQSRSSRSATEVARGPHRAAGTAIPSSLRRRESIGTVGGIGPAPIPMITIPYASFVRTKA